MQHAACFPFLKLNFGCFVRESYEQRLLVTDTMPSSACCFPVRCRRSAFDADGRSNHAGINRARRAVNVHHAFLGMSLAVDRYFAAVDTIVRSPCARVMYAALASNLHHAVHSMLTVVSWLFSPWELKPRCRRQGSCEQNPVCIVVPVADTSSACIVGWRIPAL